MKKLLDAKNKEIVHIYDEINLWSAPFGRLLLENIPMKSKAQIVDIGFGTGFPLIELGQRFGEHSKIVGIDVWEQAINRTKTKISTLQLNNVEIIEESATKIKIEDNLIDLVTSNLGVNNFEQKELVYAETYRILKTGGKLCITTNPVGTFKEFFELFILVLKEMKLDNELKQLEIYIKHRKTKTEIISEIENHNFIFSKSQSDSTNMRFVDAEAVLNHSLIRIGFRESWEQIISSEDKHEFFKRLIHKINNVINEKGELCMTIPMLYLEFEKE